MPRSSGGAEDRQPLTVEQHRLLMVDPVVRRHLDGNARQPDAIDVPRVPEPSDVAVLLGVGIETDRDVPPREGVEHGIAVARSVMRYIWTSIFWVSALLRPTARVS
jgi:hypothetical protein